MVIALDAGSPHTQLVDTLLHEITHALLASTGLEDEVIERVCLAMGPGLLALFNDNPELIRYLDGSSA